MHNVCAIVYEYLPAWYTSEMYRLEIFIVLFDLSTVTYFIGLSRVAVISEFIVSYGSATFVLSDEHKV